jgi:hypothetical protein
MNKAIHFHLTYTIAKSRGKLPRNLNFSLNGEKLEIVNSFKYLGIGNFKRAEQSIAGKATVAFYEVFNNLGMNLVDFEHQLMILP